MSIRPTITLVDPSPGAPVVTTLDPETLENSLAEDPLGSAVAISSDAAGLADDSPATYSTAYSVGDGIDKASLTWREEWICETAATAGTVTNVALIAKHLRNTQCTATIRASIDGISLGTATAVIDAARETTWNFPLRPNDGMSSWTNAVINTSTFGWFIAAGGIGVADTAQVYVEEFRVEVTYS